MTSAGPPERRDKRRYCGARKKQGEGCCKRPAGWGTDHPGSGQCKLHGGCMPNNRQAALTERASRLLYQFEAEPVENPLTALQALAGRALALEQVIGGIVNELTSIRYDTEAGGEQLRSEVVVLERAMDRCGKILVDIAKLNIEERLAKVTERQIEIVGNALTQALADLGLPVEQQNEARGLVARHLRAV